MLIEFVHHCYEEKNIQPLTFLTLQTTEKKKFSMKFPSNFVNKTFVNTIVLAKVQHFLS